MEYKHKLGKFNFSDGDLLLPIKPLQLHAEKPGKQKSNI